MKIKTRRFGEIEINEQKIISMPSGGMLGFRAHKRYVLLDREETRPFCWYQSVDDPDLAMIVIDPLLFQPDYSVDLQPAIREMEWEDMDKSNLVLYAVVNISDDEPPDITANLIGPVVINTKTCEAIQMVISDSPYSHQEKVLR
ncbi:MAG: flagellar assembly protein FliW [Proteobacteria bacterium]|nr:flagellar assembly protein FliW [Pseudomonadota bacterium]